MAEDWHPAWTFGVNIAIALSTLAAAGVALYLGHVARADQRKRDEAEGAAERRQITAVFEAIKGSARILALHVVNGSPDVITNVNVEHYGPPYESYGYAVWHSDYNIPPFVQGKATASIEGVFYDQGQPDQPVRAIEVDPRTIGFVLTWTDAHGQWWARRNGSDPYKTDAAKPGRDSVAFTAGMKWSIWDRLRARWWRLPLVRRHLAKAIRQIEQQRDGIGRELRVLRHASRSVDDDRRLADLEVTYTELVTRIMRKQMFRS